MTRPLCTCKENNGVYSVNGMWGYTLHCSLCEKPKEDGFTYHSEEEYE
jgi:hypothetical protein